MKQSAVNSDVCTLIYPYMPNLYFVCFCKGFEAFVQWTTHRCETCCITWRIHPDLDTIWQWIWRKPSHLLRSPGRVKVRWFKHFRTTIFMDICCTVSFFNYFFWISSLSTAKYHSELRCVIVSIQISWVNSKNVHFLHWFL